MKFLNPVCERVPPYVALIPVCAGVFLAADDQTVVVTVLPQIMLDMEVQVTELDRASWVVTGYLLGYLAAMPLIGRMSDVWGHRRLYVLSMLAFAAASVAVASTQSLDWLIGVRVVQALGAGALVPIAIAIVGDLFPAGRRALPLGIVGASAEAGGVIGPLWGGVIIQYLDWRWVFWINVPLGILTVALVLLLLRPSPRFRTKIDVIGGVSIGAILSCTALALSRIDSFDWFAAAFAASAAGGLCLFVWRQRRTTDSLLPRSMFRVLAFSAANVTHLLVGAGLIVGMVTIPLMANTVMGRTPLEGGLWLMRMTVAIPVGAVLGGILSQRIDVRLPAVIGLAVAAFGYWLVSTWSLDVAEPELTLHLTVAGLGFGLLIVPIALAGTETVGEGVRAVAASMVTAMRIVGMAFGLAALTAWGTSRFAFFASDIRLPFQAAGETTAQYQERVDQFTQQLQEAGMTLFQEFFLIGAAVCLLAVIPAVLMIMKKAPADAFVSDGLGPNGPVDKARRVCR